MIELEFSNWFLGSEENLESPEKNPWSKGENQLETLLSNIWH